MGDAPAGKRSAGGKGKKKGSSGRLKRRKVEEDDDGEEEAAAAVEETEAPPQHVRPCFFFLKALALLGFACKLPLCGRVVPLKTGACFKHACGVTWWSKED